MDETPGYSKSIVPAHEVWIETVRFFPDGQRLLTTAINGETKLWTFSRGDFWSDVQLTCVQTFERYALNYRDIVFTPDGDLVIVYGNNWTQVWDVEATRWCLDLWDEDEEFMLLAKGGRLMVTEARWRHGGMRVWDLQRREPLATLRFPSEKISPHYHPAMEDMTQDEIDMHTPSALITGVSAVGDDKFAVSTENYKTFLFDLNGLRLEKALRFRASVVHPNGHTAFHSGSSPGLVAFDLFDDNVKRIDLDGAVGYHGFGLITFLPDGRMVTTNENTMRVWREGDWDCVLTIPDVHEQPKSEARSQASINGLVVFPDGKRVATSSANDLPRVWDLDTGACTPMTGSPDADAAPDAKELALHARGLIGVTSSGLRLWDTQTGALIWSMDADCRALDVAPNGRIACAAGKNLIVVTPEA